MCIVTLLLSSRVPGTRVCIRSTTSMSPFWSGTEGSLSEKWFFLFLGLFRHTTPSVAFSWSTIHCGLLSVRLGKTFSSLLNRIPSLHFLLHTFTYDILNRKLSRVRSPFCLTCIFSVPKLRGR